MWIIGFYMSFPKRQRTQQMLPAQCANSYPVTIEYPEGVPNSVGESASYPASSQNGIKGRRHNVCSFIHCLRIVSQQFKLLELFHRLGCGCLVQFALQLQKPTQLVGIRLTCCLHGPLAM